MIGSNEAQSFSRNFQVKHIDKREEVERFLQDFQAKMKDYDVAFSNERGMNAQVLADLEIRSVDRKLCLERLTLGNYCHGFLVHSLYPYKIWVFGIVKKKSEICIKASMGIENSNVVCTLFDIARDPLHYPFKLNSNSIY